MRAQSQHSINRTRDDERNNGCFQHQYDIVENIRMCECFDQLRAGGNRGAAVAEIGARQNRTAKEYWRNLHGRAERHGDDTHGGGRGKR